MESKVVACAEVYAILAEALAEPPLWMAGAGPEWPLFEVLVRVAGDSNSQTIGRAVEALASIRPESLATRRQRYQRLFSEPGRPTVWLYESLYVDGRILGPATMAVQQVYRAAGLAVDGPELADHAALELAFLGRLAEQSAAHPAQAAEWEQLARRFIERHAGRWLPEVGRSLAASGDPVYGPIGQLLVAWLAEMSQPRRQRVKTGASLPFIPRPESCTLCGFCAQVCPTQALLIRETDIETGLVLLPAICIGCAKCERVCDFGALEMTTRFSPDSDALSLRISARANCPGCGRPTVSQAELKTIAAGLGRRPHWLNYCLECRLRLKEKVCKSPSNSQF